MWDSFLRKKFSDLLFRKTVTSLKIQDDVVWPFFVEVIAKLSPTLDMTKKLNWLFHSTRDRLSTVRRIDVDLICSGFSTWYVHFFEKNSSVLLLFIGLNTEIQRSKGLLLEHLVCFMKPQNLLTYRQMCDSFVTMAADILFRSRRSHNKGHGLSADVEFFSLSEWIEI